MWIRSSNSTLHVRETTELHSPSDPLFSRHFPACAYGAECLYIHPPCRFSSACTRPGCPYLHAASNPASSPSSANNTASATANRAESTIVSATRIECLTLNCSLSLVFRHANSVTIVSVLVVSTRIRVQRDRQRAISNGSIVNGERVLLTSVVSNSSFLGVLRMILRYCHLHRRMSSMKIRFSSIRVRWIKWRIVTATSQWTELFLLCFVLLFRSLSSSSSSVEHLLILLSPDENMFICYS